MDVGDVNIVMDQLAPVPLCHYRVLFVDDRKVNRKLGKMILEKLGMRCTEVASGKKALEVCRNELFDFIILDLQMPEMNGFETAKCIRNLQGPNAKAKIIALTADDQAAEREKCLEAGMDDFITKPILKEKIEAVILRHCFQK